MKQDIDIVVWLEEVLLIVDGKHQISTPNLLYVQFFVNPLSPG